MYGIIFKKDSDNFVIMDVYLKGRWEFNKKCLIGYLLFADRVAREDYYDIDEIRSLIKENAKKYDVDEIDSVIDFIEAEQMPIFVNFDALYLIGRLDKFEPGLITPPTPIIETTQFCNYNCQWCYIPTRDLKQEKYSLDVLDKNIVTPLLENFGLLEWCLTGGEPSVEKDRALEFANIITKRTIEILGRKPTSIYMLTNGFNLAENIKDYLDAGINSFQVALTSPHAETEMNLRRPPKGINSYEQVVNGLKKAKELGAKTEINMIIQPKSENYKTNLYDIPDMFNLASELKIDMLRIIPAVPTGQALVNNIFFTHEEYAYINETVAGLRGKYEDQFIVDCPLDQEIEADREVYCRAGTLWLYINFKGEIFPCNNLQFNSLMSKENVVDYKVDYIWLKSDILLKMRDYNVNTLSEECYTCDKRIECAGECRALCWARYNEIDLSNKPPVCYANRGF